MFLIPLHHHEGRDMLSAPLYLHICDTAEITSCSDTLRSFDVCDFHSERQEVYVVISIEQAVTHYTGSGGDIFCVVSLLHFISQFSTFRLTTFSLRLLYKLVVTCSQSVNFPHRPSVNQESNQLCHGGAAEDRFEPLIIKK